MKYLLTGGSGFLGAIIKDKLSPKHEVISLGRSISNDIIADLSKEKAILPKVDVLIHAAGKAHIVPKTESEKAEFFKVNVEGTRNLLASIQENPRTIIFISSVAVYGLEEGELVAEDHELKGETPYAESKVKAEKLVLDWGKKNGVNVLVLRLPLIVGQNAPGNLGAIIKAIRKGYYFRFGEGKAKKSMVLADDVADFINGYGDKSGIYNLTDGEDPTMAELDQYLSEKFDRKVKPFPMGPLRILAKVGDNLKFFPLNSYRLEKLQTSLTFSSQKAVNELGWKPKPVIGNFDPR